MKQTRETPKPRTPRQTPKAKAPVIPETVAVTPVADTPEAQAPRANLAGVTIGVDAFKKPTCYRPYIKIRFPDGIHYTKLVPGGRTATKDEALAKASAYRETVLASGELPPQAPRPDRFGWDAEAAEGMILTTVDGRVIPLGGPDAEDPA